MSDDILSQEELDALLKSGIEEIEDDKSDNLDENKEQNNNSTDDILTDLEIDALGEIGNISMGTAATTLSTLLDKKVDITTPSVTITSPEELAAEYERPLVAVDVSYKEGLEGSNIMILRTTDAIVITDLMMGKDEVDLDREITELDLSAVSEAMNQMMGSSATSLSEMLDMKIDILPPLSEEVTFSEGREILDILKTTGPIIKISFRMVIADYLDSNIMQLVPVKFGKEMVKKVINIYSGEEEVKEEPVPTEFNKTDSYTGDGPKVEEKVDENLEELNKEEGPDKSQSQIDTQQSVASQNYQMTNQQYMPPQQPVNPVEVSAPTFNSFAQVPQQAGVSEINLVGDIPVEVTVELGRTNKKIGEILEFGVGTVVELDKLVGEALNIYANGKYIASGEVVVIDDSFGVRLTEIDTENQKII